MSALVIAHSPHQQRGFTLLELVLVMFIIALIASTPLLFIDEQDQQLRYDETQQKMRLIQSAIYQRDRYQDQPLLSGFIIDNGVLPPETHGVSPLLNQTAEYDGSTQQTWRDYSNWLAGDIIAPYFTVAGSSGELNSSLAMRKGYFGPYISRSLDSQQALKDGWGNDFIIVSAGNSYQIDSSNAVATLSQRINANDWLVPLTELDITVVNDSSLAIAEPVALLVFQNGDEVNSNPQAAWTTYSFDVAIASGASYTPPADVWSQNNVTLSASEAHSSLIPAGKHLLIFDPEQALVTSTPHVFFTVFPGSIQPSVRLRIP